MRRSTFCLAALLLTSACLSPMDPRQADVAAVRVTIGASSAAVDTIQVRGTTRVAAAALAREGYDLGLSDFTYASSDTAVAVVDANGTVRGVAPGSATITATRGSRSGSAKVVVVPSTVAYTIVVGTQPSDIAFSTDYTRAYVLVGGDSIAIVQALGFYRLRTLSVGLAGHALAATSSAVYVTHPLVDSVSVISSATGDLLGRIWVGAGPEDVVASANRAYVSARYDRRVVIVEGTSAPLGIPVGGEPTRLAVSADGARLFAGVQRSDGWHLVSIAPAYPDTLASIALPAEPAALATDRTGSRVYVLLGGASPRVLAFTVNDNGVMTPAGELAAGAGATGVAARPVGTPWLVVSGEPTIVTDAVSLSGGDRIAAGGTGAVAIRPDGLFAFVLDPGQGVVRVIGL